MIKVSKEEWIATIEGWYQEVFSDKEKAWELERVTRNIFGTSKIDLAKELINNLKCQNTMWILEKEELKALKRLINVQRLEKALIELIETPIE